MFLVVCPGLDQIGGLIKHNWIVIGERVLVIVCFEYAELIAALSAGDFVDLLHVGDGEWLVVDGAHGNGSVLAVDSLLLLVNIALVH